jgi:hypothetical protein
MNRFQLASLVALAVVPLTATAPACAATGKVIVKAEDSKTETVDNPPNSTCKAFPTEGPDRGRVTEVKNDTNTPMVVFAEVGCDPSDGSFVIPAGWDDSRDFAQGQWLSYKFDPGAIPPRSTTGPYGG